MAFIGERGFLERQLDDLWELMEAIVEYRENVGPEEWEQIDREYQELDDRYQYYFKRLQECEIPWWKS